MSPRSPQDEQLIDRLTEVFQTYGYQGASLTLLSEATGLQRASLYHRFPGGKVEMAEAIFDRAVQWLSEHALQPLGQPGSPADRVRAMTRKLAEFYDSGRRSCLLDTLSLGPEETPFRDRVKGAIEAWIGAMAAVARDAGFPPRRARALAEEALVQVEGSLVVSRGSGDTATFSRALERLPGLLAGAG